MERALAAWNYLRAVSHRANRRIYPASRPADGCDGPRWYLCLSGPHVQWFVVARGPWASSPGGGPGRGRGESDLEIVCHRARGLPDDVPARPGERAGQPRQFFPGGVLQTQRLPNDAERLGNRSSLHERAFFVTEPSEAGADDVFQFVPRRQGPPPPVASLGHDSLDEGPGLGCVRVDL